MMSDEDDELWDKMMEDVTPLSGRSLRSHHTTNKPLPKVKSPAPHSQPPRTESSSKGGKELDRRTSQKLTRGQIPIEGRLDLHGMTQDQAHRALTPFILNAHEKQKRCVLVVTGKGQGILQKQVPLWLEQDLLNHIVLRTATAQPKDGGSGALYVYLRRHRT